MKHRLTFFSWLLISLLAGHVALFVCGFIWGAGEVIFRFGRHQGINATVNMLMPMTPKADSRQDAKAPSKGAQR
jgi:hypothetical protein